MTNKITRELLKEWYACTDGFKRFCELFPEGATLEVAIKGLVDDGHDDWGKWLFNRSKENKLFEDITSKGYRNSGDHNSGYYNSGDHNSGYYNSGDHNSGDYNSGDYNSGYYNSGYYNSGYYNSGDRNSGDRNSGYCNSGDYNSGYYNSGYYNSGYYNSGNRNSGNYNSGDHNSGNYNSGYYNSGYYNSGYCNSGNRNSGIFCSVEPAQSLFNKPTQLMFNSPEIQQIVGVINSVKSIMTWIYSDNMSDEEKANNPSHTTTGGYLKKQDLKYCWKKAWQGFSDKQKNIIINAPNFDAAVFEEITGVKVNE